MRTKLFFSLLLLLAAGFFSGCNHLFRKKTNWDVSLNREDKKPYGSFLAFESLKYFFPSATITPLSGNFRYNNIDGKMMQQQRALFIAVGLDFFVSEPELERLMLFAKKGNEVVIFSRANDEKIEHFFQYKLVHSGIEEMPLSEFNTGKENLNSLWMKPDGRKYGYEGRSLLASFYKRGKRKEKPANKIARFATEFKGAADTLGFAKNKPNMLRFALGKGHITLHAAPLVMSNYFLLQDHNYRYLQEVWNTLPANITQVYWNDYYKRSTKAADLSVLLQYPATRWAFILLVFTLLMYLVFEGRRKQRIIAEIKPLENSSVSFAETIGRLYYHQGNHTNIGEKMIQHFLEWVRTHYFINTNKLDGAFAEQLVRRSGLPESVVQSLMEMIREVHVERKPIDDTDLYHLHQTIQQFYNSYSKQ